MGTLLPELNDYSNEERFTRFDAAKAVQGKAEDFKTQHVSESTSERNDRDAATHLENISRTWHQINRLSLVIISISKRSQCCSTHSTVLGASLGFCAATVSSLTTSIGDY